MSAVIAVVVGPPNQAADRLSPPTVEGVVSVPSLSGIRQAAASARSPLLWLVDCMALPDHRTLPPLLDHAPGPAASLPVDRHDRPLEPLIGRVADSDVPAILEAVAGRRLPLRHMPVTSLLVERELVLDLAAPDPARFGWYAGSEWTARLFARRRGMLVPASRVRVEGAGAGSPLHLLRAARSARWRKGETLREVQRAMTAGMS